HRPIGSTGMGWAVMSLSRMERAWVTRRERYGRGGRGKPYVGRPTHGFSKTPTYKSWDSAKQRCTNPADDHWPDYGGRGIGMCARWLQSFENFLTDMGKRPDGTTLDRLDVNGDYSPENCRWATPIEQHNNKRINTFVEYDGKRQTIAQWSRETGIHPDTLRRR